MVVLRSRRNTFVFQREFSKERSRWCDRLADCIEEIEHYLNSGTLKSPDSIVGF